MGWFGRWTALVAAAALLAAGCAGPSGGDGGPWAEQRLGWGRCRASAQGPAPGGDWQCATLRAPLDWSEPDGATIGLALIRSTARGGERRGSLLFNFGGPGGSGVFDLPSYEDTFATLHAAYDLVSWDPRGVGASEGIRCRGDRETRAAESLDATPDSPAEERAYFADAAGFGRGCRQAAGRLLAHVSTTDTARDLDLIRRALGDDTLHYFGTSYGTELGGVYAHLFPERVGRLVLDAVVDPTADTTQSAEGQARGFQRALRAYLESSGGDPDQGVRRITDLLERLDARPLATSTPGRRLTQTLAVTGIALAMYSESFWPRLTGALKAADEGDGSGLLGLADAYNDRDASGRYGTAAHSQRVIQCLDSGERPTAEQVRALLPRFRDVSPVFGEFLAWDTAGWCHDWPVPGGPRTPEVSAPGAAPVLVVGNTGDPATPYEGARRMADELGGDTGVVLTWRGRGHGAYGSGSICVDSAIDAYLLHGRVPRDGKICP